MLFRSALTKGIAGEELAPIGAMKKAGIVALTDDGHFMVECIHNCGHSEPPFDAPNGFSKYKGMWDFILDHPYWVSDGDSIYQTEGVAPDMPEWCAIGAGNATPRTGECINPSEC